MFIQANAGYVGGMDSISIDNISIRVLRKRIKNIHLRVYPPDGRVQLSIPNRMTDPQAREFLVLRLPWIKKQQEKLIHHGPVIHQQFITGERHPFLGNPYPLTVIEKQRGTGIQLAGGRLLMSIRPGTSRERREKMLTEWYRRQLKQLVPPLVRQYEPMLGVTVTSFRIRKMRSRWGSCNTRRKTILLNLELARRPVECLEYVVVHEMVHLLERGHNRRFYRLMDHFLPGWQAIRQQLG